MRPFPLAVLLLFGCAPETSVLAPASPAPAAEEQAVRDEVERSPDLVEDSLYESLLRTEIDAEAVAARAGETIRPLFFWRTIRDVQRRFEFAFADSDSTGRPTAVVVTVHKRLTGHFNILVADQVGEGDPLEAHVIRKPLQDHWVRRMLLRRVANPTLDRGLWRIAATSGVEITSRNAATRLVSLRVKTASWDTTLTNPLAFFRLRRIPRFEPGGEIEITATTLRNDDVVVLYARDRRFRFHNNGDNTYTARWKVAWRAGVHHFGINALARGTLFDDRAPYDSQTWILPYVVAPTLLADLEP
jgi:hypothetical protein